MPSEQRYISNILYHFIGKNARDDEQRYEILKTILNEKAITHPPHNPLIEGNIEINYSLSFEKMINPQSVCFADIPLNDLKRHMNHYGGFGIGFKKEHLIERGANPIFYIATNSKLKAYKKDDNGYVITTDGRIEKEWVDRQAYFLKNLERLHEYLWHINPQINPKTTPLLNEEDALRELKEFINFHILSYFKPWKFTENHDDPDNYYFEREWRIIGHLFFDLNDVKQVIIPKNFCEQFRHDFADYYGELIFSD